MGAQKFKGKVVIPSLGQGGGADLKYADIVVSNAELKAIRATRKILVPAPGTGKVLEFLSGSWCWPPERTSSLRLRRTWP